MQNITPTAEIVLPGYPKAQNRPFPEQPTWQQAMKQAIRSAAELRRRLQLPPGNSAAEHAEKSFPTFVPLEYLRRMEPGNLADPLLLQVLPLQTESEQVAGFVSDPVGDGLATISLGLLQKYDARALIIATGACGIHCRYCFRREYDYATADNGSWETVFKALRNRPDIDEVILSGGDPLTLSETKFEHLVTSLESIPQLKRLRIHSRMPIVIPQRVTERLVDRLQSSRLAVWMVVHCNHPAEIDNHVEDSLSRLVDGGIPVLNQAVLLRGVNDSVDVLESLCRHLINLRVHPYYLHQLDRVQGAAHFEVPIETGLAIVEQLRSRLPGYAVPRYVTEVAGQASKTPL